MNTDRTSYNNFGTAGYITKTAYAGHGSIMKIHGKIFCEVPSGMLGVKSMYYDYAEFAGINVIQRLAKKSLGNQPDNLWALRRPYISTVEGLSQISELPEELVAMANYLCDEMIMKDICSYLTTELQPYKYNPAIAVADEKSKKIEYRSDMSKTDLFYVIDNVVYSKHFPLNWAVSPVTVTETKRICGPGSTPNHCRDCTYNEHIMGVFVGYCANCADVYASSRDKCRYLKNVSMRYFGYDPNAVCCLVGGPVPTTPDICDNQEDVDLVREDVVDTYQAIQLGKIRASGRYPRRAYGILNMLKFDNGFSVGQSDVMTPDLIRQRMDSFLAANQAYIEITDNNYSFPIGPRPADDYYRILKRPSWWFAWNITLRDAYGACNLEIRLYVSNVHTEETPALMQLRCNKSRGYYIQERIMMDTMKGWILGKIDSPVMVIPIEDDDV